MPHAWYNCMDKPVKGQRLHNTKSRELRIGKRRRDLRRRSAARLANVSAPLWGQIEAGKYIPNRDSVILRRICVALDWPLDHAGELLDPVDEDAPREG
jgi:hypothetical protein